MTLARTESSEEVAYQRSLAMLQRCLSPAGFLASPTDVDNYARVWARDGVISGLAALASGKPELVAGMENTVITLRRWQGPHGEIPSNVTVDSSQISYGRLVGRVDALLWYVLGVCAFLQYVGETKSGERYAQFQFSVERALFLAGCWEFNDRGLIYTPISGNWADEYIQQGYVLSDQLLYLLALRSAGRVFDSQIWQAKAEALEQLVAVNYWPRVAFSNNSLVYHPYAYQRQLSVGELPYWLPAFSPSGYMTYFDGLAHALVLLTELGDEGQRQEAEHYIQALEEQIGSPLLPAFWPVIQPGSSAWDALESNHLYGQMKNRPYMYHNGGLWPVLTGFYIMGLARNNQQGRAQHVLAALNAANAQGEDGEQWEFAEYHHGQTYAPLGTKYLAWSAAAGVLAHQAIYERISFL